MDEVWVVEMWEAHGEGCHVHGLYADREAAFEALKQEPNMTVYVDDDGMICGRPRKERRSWQDWGRPQNWASGRPMKIQQRQAAAAQAR